MGISKYFNANKAKQEIATLISKRVHNDHLKNDCGKILNDLGRMYGYEIPNQIIHELKLDQSLGLKMVCPAANNLANLVKPKKD